MIFSIPHTINNTIHTYNLNQIRIFLYTNTYSQTRTETMEPTYSELEKRFLIWLKEHFAETRNVSYEQLVKDMGLSASDLMQMPRTAALLVQEGLVELLHGSQWDQEEQRFEIEGYEITQEGLQLLRYMT